MDKIIFRNVLPSVFANREDLHSEIWKSDVTLERDHLYLVEAASGQGKSTFCSYVVGYRNDYSGQVLFDDVDIHGLKVGQWVNIRKNHISHLFQELRLFPELTAMENVEIKNKLTGFKTRQQPAQLLLIFLNVSYFLLFRCFESFPLQKYTENIIETLKNRAFPCKYDTM